MAVSSQSQAQSQAVPSSPKQSQAVPKKKKIELGPDMASMNPKNQKTFFLEIFLWASSLRFPVSGIFGWDMAVWRFYRRRRHRSRRRRLRNRHRRLRNRRRRLLPTAAGGWQEQPPQAVAWPAEPRSGGAWVDNQAIDRYMCVCVYVCIYYISVCITVGGGAPP